MYSGLIFIYRDADFSDVGTTTLMAASTANHAINSQPTKAGKLEDSTRQSTPTIPSGTDA